MAEKLKTDDARYLALMALDACLQRQQPLENCLRPVYASALLPQDKGFARELVMGVLRWHGILQREVRHYVKQPLATKYQLAYLIVEMGMLQLRVLKTPAHAAIHTSVELARQLGLEPVCKLINAILREVSRHNGWQTPQHTATLLPDWLAARYQRIYGAEIAEKMAQSLLVSPRLDIMLKERDDHLMEVLEAEPIFSNLCSRPMADVAGLPAYQDGAWWVQDRAASLPVLALGEIKGRHILDIAAAPGGKTAQCLAAGATVTAIDRSPRRLRRMQENMQRLDFLPHIIEADMMQWSPDFQMDAILMDAPCSATGTLRRHPDLMWQKDAKEIAEMAAIQRQWLAHLMTWLPVGVPCVYATCSLEPEEGELQIEHLLQTHTNLTLLPISLPDIPSGLAQRCITDKGYLRTLPHFMLEQGGMDGFFAAKFMRMA